LKGPVHKTICYTIKTREKCYKHGETLKYKFMRQKAKTLIFKSKRDFYSAEISSNKKNPKKLCNNLREISGLKPNLQTQFINDRQWKSSN
jgi:predicted RNase H-like nuclease (RuvC/YqgF family)